MSGGNLLAGELLQQEHLSNRDVSPNSILFFFFPRAEKNCFSSGSWTFPPRSKVLLLCNSRFSGNSLQSSQIRNWCSPGLTMNLLMLHLSMGCGWFRTSPGFAVANTGFVLVCSLSLCGAAVHSHAAFTSHRTVVTTGPSSCWESFYSEPGDKEDPIKAVLWTTVCCSSCDFRCRSFFIRWLIKKRFPWSWCYTFLGVLHAFICAFEHNCRKTGTDVLFLRFTPSHHSFRGSSCTCFFSRLKQASACLFLSRAAITIIIMMILLLLLFCIQTNLSRSWSVSFVPIFSRRFDWSPSLSCGLLPSREPNDLNTNFDCRLGFNPKPFLQPLRRKQTRKTSWACAKAAVGWDIVLMCYPSQLWDVIKVTVRAGLIMGKYGCYNRGGSY